MNYFYTPKWVKKICLFLYKTYLKWLNFIDKVISIELRFETWLKATRTYKFFERRAKMIILVNVAILFARNYFLDKEKKQLEKSNKEKDGVISGLQTQKLILNANMDQTWVPWAQVRYSNGKWKVIGTNEAYDREFGKREIDLLGYSNFDVFLEEIAKVYRYHDSIAVTLMGESIYVKEPNPGPNFHKGDLFVIKKATSTELDTIVEMKIFYLNDIIQGIDEMPNLEVIEIQGDTLPDAVQPIIKTEIE